MTAYHRPRPDRPDDPWDGRTPLMRRPAVRAMIALVAVGSFLFLTLMSTCAPRRRVRPEPTTTTTEVVASPAPSAADRAAHRSGTDQEDRRYAGALISGTG